VQETGTPSAMNLGGPRERGTRSCAKHACAAIGCKNPDGAITIWDDVPHGLEVLVSSYLAETDE